MRMQEKYTVLRKYMIELGPGHSRLFINRRRRMPIVFAGYCALRLMAWPDPISHMDIWAAYLSIW